MARALTPAITSFSSRAAVEMASVVFEHEGEALLLDPGILPDEVEAIAAFVQARGLHVAGVLLTHAHWDHIGATSRWPDAPVLTHRRFPAWLAAVEAEEPLNEARRRTWAQFGLPAPAEIPLPAPTALLDEGAELLGGAARALHLPGHLGDAVGLLFPAEGVLACADMLDSVELPLPLQDVDAYLASLTRIEGLLDLLDHVVPGHGPPLDRAAARAQLGRDRDYVGAVLAGVEDALRRGRPFDAAWPELAALPHFGKGDPARDGEHRLVCAEVHAQRAGERPALP